MRHARKPDTMTYPDVIWPAFTFMLGLSVPLAVEKRLAGFLLRPVYGCWKRGATPTWALYSTGISCLIFAGLYTLVDV